MARIVMAVPSMSLALTFPIQTGTCIVLFFVLVGVVGATASSVCVIVFFLINVVIVRFSKTS